VTSGACWPDRRGESFAVTMPSEASTSKALLRRTTSASSTSGDPRRAATLEVFDELHAEPRMRLRRPSSARLLALRRQSAAEEARVRARPLHPRARPMTRRPRSRGRCECPVRSLRDVQLTGRASPPCALPQGGGPAPRRRCLRACPELRRARLNFARAGRRPCSAHAPRSQS
jgi:hypothetical protein